MSSRDFLGRFGGQAARPEHGGGGGGGGGESDEIELSLGLSLGGCFGLDPRESKKPRLVRSSSIASICSLAGDDFPAVAAAAAVPLMRTSSLPTETEEERWRRREMQSLKRLEAKRKRLERKNSINSVKSGAGAGAGAGKDDVLELPFLSGVQLRRNANGFPPPMPQGSAGSQASSSASVPEQGLDIGGIGNSMEVRSPSADNSNALPPAAVAATGNALNGTITEQSPLRTLRSLTMRTSSTGDIRKSMMEDMPMVSSKVDGPNGRRIDGFLYKYRKGEEVRIVCVCHGNFLTPAEFVKHAGGGDVTNPLRHIVVNPSPSVFL